MRVDLVKAESCGLVKVFWLGEITISIMFHVHILLCWYSLVVYVLSIFLVNILAWL